MRLVYLLSLSALALLCSTSGVQGPRSFMTIHCEPTSAQPVNFLALVSLVGDADDKNVPLTIEFTPPWAEMILADAMMLAQVRAWQLAGHELGGHHHPVDGPVTWDGYTDLEPGTFTDPVAYQGTMTDYKLLLDALVGGEGLKSGGIPSHDYEWPYGTPYVTGGDNDITLAVSTPQFEVTNNYGVWTLDHAALSTVPQLQYLKDEHGMAGDDEIVGAITHVFNYKDDPSIIQAWFDYLESGDPSGDRNMTVSELLEDQPDPLEADVVSISAITGGSVDLTLFSDASLAGDLVLFLPSLSGSDPGYAFGGVYDTGVHIGINIDTLTLVALQNLSASWLSGFFGTLDSAGGASATFVAPAALPPSIIGSSLTFTAIASGSAFSQLDFSANPVSVAITP